MKTKAPKASVLETAFYFKLPAGDNSAESSLGHVTSNQRRLGALRSSNRADERGQNVQSFCASALYRQAGFQRVLDAIAAYRVACSSGAVKVPPAAAFKADDLPWLKD